MPLGFGPAGPVLFDPNKAAVIFADPRILLVHLALGQGPAMAILVAHAPRKGQPEEVKRAWWDTILSLLQRHWYALDANAAIGNLMRPGLGALAPSDEDYNGLRLRNLLDCFDLSFPSTFEGVHEGAISYMVQQCSSGNQWTTPGLHSVPYGLETLALLFHGYS